MISENGILFDDYGKNINEWLEKRGNLAYKITNELTIMDLIETIRLINN